MSARAPVLVLGVGNELFTDEGIGVAAARRVARLLDGAPGVEVLDGATLGLGLLPAIAGRRSVLVLDAVLAEGTPPGGVVVLRGEDVVGSGALWISVHQIGVGEALAAARFAGLQPDRLAAVGMVPASLDTGCGLSPCAERALDTLAARALELLTGWGVEVPAHA